MIVKIYGPPGTGKTQYLLDRFEEELKVVEPNRIAFLTFTRAARETALARSNRTEDELPYLRTIHSICYRQLGITQSLMISDKDLQEFGKLIGLELTGRLKDPWVSSDEAAGWIRPKIGDVLLQLNHLGRHRGIRLNEALKYADMEIDYHFARSFTKTYRDWKTRESLVDFTDLLTDYIAVGEPLNIDVLFVDEAQDLSRLQWDVVAKLGANAQRVYIAGDDDQAIFSWAGADARRFIDYKSDRTVILNYSYRLPKSIHHVAMTIANRIGKRAEKRFTPRDADGEVRGIGAGQIDPSLLMGSTFVLFRNHFRGRALAENLESISVPFIGETGVLSHPTVSLAVKGVRNAIAGESISMSEAQALVGYVSSNWIAPRAKERVNAKERATWRYDDIFLRQPEITTWTNMLSRMPGREYVSRCVRFFGWRETLNPHVNLLSIHQSKGRQADTVILDLDLTRKTYDSWMRDPDDEHRCWYVGVTRAKERLFTLLPTTDWRYEI